MALVATVSSSAPVNTEKIGNGGLPEDAFRDLLEYTDERDVRVVSASDVLDAQS